VADPILVAYGTKFGATAEIAEAIAGTLRAEGFAVDLRRAREVRSVDGYRAVVLGSAVYMARWRRDAARLLRRRRRALARLPVWLFSSGPVGEEPDDGDSSERWTQPKLVRRLAAEIGARDHAVFGGRVSEDAGGFIRRSMARSTPPDLRDRRDRPAIEAWARGIAASLARPGAERADP
jgi:menaquinone-dependent protoporphyrinogen oxidase